MLALFSLYLLQNVVNVAVLLACINLFEFWLMTQIVQLFGTGICVGALRCWVMSDAGIWVFVN
jgi:hypothetical protein